MTEMEKKTETMGLAKYVVLVYFEKKNNNGVSVGKNGKTVVC